MGPLSDEQLSLRLRAEAQSLVGFITMLTGDRHLADDIFQDTCLEVWRARDRYLPGADFGVWVRGFARNVVLRHRRRQGRDRSAPFGPELMEQLADTWEETARESDGLGRRSALAECLERLAPDQREILRWRYDDHCSLETIAVQTGRSREAVKMGIHRLRRKLFRCIESRLRKEEIDAV